MLIRILAHARTGNHALPKVQLCFKPAGSSLRFGASARESRIVCNSYRASARRASRRDGLDCISASLRLFYSAARIDTVANDAV